MYKPKKYLRIVKNILARRLFVESPYIEEFDRKKCIFIHIPKCAGISIEESILDGQKPGHHKLTDYMYYNPCKFYKYFVFTFVRNPITRFESAFTFLKSGGRNPVDKQWAEEHLVGFETVDELVNRMRANTRLRTDVETWQHFRPQVSYLLDENGNLPIDYIGRLETIQRDFEEICSRIGIKRQLPHKNKSTKSESEVLSNKNNISFLREELYNQDFKMLGYE